MRKVKVIRDFVIRVLKRSWKFFRVSVLGAQIALVFGTQKNHVRDLKMRKGNLTFNGREKELRCSIDFLCLEESRSGKH
ncbi:hypothetical protein CEXT_215151 [Caerostris extrusa]|uniref:Uncharacterized protein n=1 Tax=Caerostris extrusa TaxID=172846 RepID=A0AAV4NQ20_CAEEX|nr:hypothetical protein CEXT_215151 [Caerostris extrusa]